MWTTVNTWLDMPTLDNHSALAAHAPHSLQPLQPVHSLDFEEQVMASPVPVLVDFATAWCGPCRMLTPVLRALATENADRLKVVTVDADESPDLAARFGVRGFPTVIAFMNGREVGRQLGVARKEKLLALVSNQE